MRSQKAELDKAESAWSEALARWAIPEKYLAQVADSPFELSPSSFKPQARRLETPTLRWAKEELERLDPGQRTLIDIGSAAGGTSLLLWPTAEHITAVDQSAGMLESLNQNAAELGIPENALTTINTTWPPKVPLQASVAVCANVLYNVGSPVAFLDALLKTAVHTLIIELTEHHPHFGINPLWKKFNGYVRPSEPRAEAIGGMLTLLGYEPEVARWQRKGVDLTDAEEISRLARRACIPAERVGELEKYLREEPLAPTEVVAFRVHPHE